MSGLFRISEGDFTRALLNEDVRLGNGEEARTIPSFLVGQQMSRTDLEGKTNVVWDVSSWRCLLTSRPRYLVGS